MGMVWAWRGPADGCNRVRCPAVNWRFAPQNPPSWGKREGTRGVGSVFPSFVMRREGDGWGLGGSGWRAFLGDTTA